jgi:hypothetical protein
MEAISSSETSGATQGTARRHIPEGDTLHIILFHVRDKIAQQYCSELLADHSVSGNHYQAGWCSSNLHTCIREVLGLNLS